jgi:hypothetical protein
MPVIPHDHRHPPPRPLAWLRRHRIRETMELLQTPGIGPCYSLLMWRISRDLPVTVSFLISIRYEPGETTATFRADRWAVCGKQRPLAQDGLKGMPLSSHRRPIALTIVSLLVALSQTIAMS